MKLQTRLLIALFLLIANNCLAGENVSSIGAGKDYKTLILWEAAKDGDITAGNSEVAELYSTDIDTGGVTIDGWICDSDSRVIIRAAAGHKHAGVHSSGAGIKLAVGSVYCVNVNNADGVIFLEVRDLILEPQRASGVNTAGVWVTSLPAGSTVIVESCIMDGNNGVKAAGMYFTDADTIGYVYNNAIMNMQLANVGAFRAAYAKLYAYNNTIYNCYNGFYLNPGEAVLKNNLVANCTGSECYAYTENYSSMSAYNMSTDGTADDDDLATSGTGMPNKTIDADDFVSITAHSEDFHIKGTGSELYNVGISLNPDPHGFLSFSDDYEGNTRSGTWDIGADEYITAAPPPKIMPVIIILDGY